MSTLESLFWHILGYAAIPIIIVIGIVFSALIFYFLVNIFVGGEDEKQ
jgi:uncharacterized protein (TIGR02808 family)